VPPLVTSRKIREAAAEVQVLLLVKVEAAQMVDIIMKHPAKAVEAAAAAHQVQEVAVQVVVLVALKIFWRKFSFFNFFYLLFNFISQTESLLASRRSFCCLIRQK
jgi:hypothetical protein